jgi:diadenylate cyclase
MEEELKKEKREVQAQIIPIAVEQNREKATNEEIINILRQLSPGTHMRSGLNGIVQAQKGALVVVETDGLSSIMDGGFKVNCRFTAQRLIELSKMDGAIILSKDMKRILYANVMLHPDTRLPTNETGTRHKTAERSARMLNTPVIAVSERKKEINLYFKNVKYPVRSTSTIMDRATQMLSILEKQRELFDNHVLELTMKEMYNELEVAHPCKVIQQGIAIEKILANNERTIIELGNEGIELKARLKELIEGVSREINLVIRDYTRLNVKKSRKLLETLSYEDLMNKENIPVALAIRDITHIDHIKGWRMLTKMSLEEREIAEILKNHGNLKKILGLTKEQFSQIIGEQKAAEIQKEIAKIRAE